MIKLNKSNLIGLKKISNLKKIPFSPKDNKNSLNDHKESILIKKKKQIMKNNYSYSEIKPKESKKFFSDISEIKDKGDLSSIKGVKLTNNKLFKKSISSHIGQSSDINLNNIRNKSNINKIIPSLLDNEDNNKKINMSHSNYKDNEETGKKHNIILSNFIKGRNGVINDSKDNKSLRRLHSHQKLTIYPEFNYEKIKPRSSKILTTFNNTLVKSSILEHNERYINDSILNQKKKLNNNNSRLNNYTEIKKSINNKGNNSLYTNSLNKIKPINLDNIHLSTLNPNNSNLKSILKTPTMTIQNQKKEKVKVVENEEEGSWDDIEYLGLKKNI